MRRLYLLAVCTVLRSSTSCVAIRRPHLHSGLPMENGLPAPVRVLRWAFVTSPRRHLFRAAMSRMFGAAGKSG